MSEPTPDCCEDSGSKMFWGILLLGLGILLMLQNLEIVDLSESWPVILIVVGVGMMLGMFGRKKTSPKVSDKAQAVPTKQDLPPVS